MASVLLNNSPHHVQQGKVLPLVSASGICMTQNKHIKSFLNVEKENPQLPHSSECCSRRVILALPVVSSGVTQNKHIKSFLKVEKENLQLPDSSECWPRRFILALPVVSSGLFFSYSAKGKVKLNQYNEKRILEQNKKIQQANQAPKDFPNFIREGFEVKVLITDKYVKSSSGLIYLDIAVGDGDCPKDGQQVTFHYTGYNESGRRIDSTYLQGSPAKIRLGNNALVPGFEEGIHDMKPGGKRRLIIPPELGPPVGPSTFFSSKQFEVFDVELLNVKDCQRRTIAFYSDVICT